LSSVKIHEDYKTDRTSHYDANLYTLFDVFAERVSRGKLSQKAVDRHTLLNFFLTVQIKIKK